MPKTPVTLFRNTHQPWAKVREGVQVKRLATEEDIYVLAQSDARIDKERGMRRKRLRRYIVGPAKPLHAA